MDKKLVSFNVPWPNLGQARAFARKWLLPNPGTLVLMIVLALVAPALAAPLGRPLQQSSSTSTISYQGRLADSAGNPLTGRYNLEFRIYDVPTGGTPLWTEMWTGANAVDVSDGLFNVMLGSIDSTLASAIQGHNRLYLGITVNTDSEMVPRVQLGSVPFAMTVPDGSITTAKIADRAVTSAKLNVDNGLTVAGTFAATGNAGIGTTSPADILHVNQGNTPTGIRWERSGYDTMRIGSIGTGFSIHNVTDNRYDLVILENGNVGIGTTNPTARLDVNGDFHVSGGTKSAVVQTPDYGKRTLYSIESPEVRFVDEGLACLKEGIARVDLDPIFMETIEGEYLVHVAPYGNAALYVAEIGQDYFVVKAREGDPNVAFAWRLSAFRKGYAEVRLEPVEQNR